MRQRRSTKYTLSCGPLNEYQIPFLTNINTHTKQIKEFEQHKCSHMFLVQPEAKQVSRETNKMADELANTFFDKFYERQHEKIVEEV